jgi:hypothetical protein
VQAFDLVYARLLSAHLPDSECALTRMVGALKLGARLVSGSWIWAQLSPTARRRTVQLSSVGA